MFPGAVFERNRANGVFIDTNLLLLLAEGAYRRGRITTFKRTKHYTSDDLMLMLGIAGYFDRRLTTPNILTEVDNLLRQLPASEHRSAAAALSNLVSQLFEVFIPTSDAVRHAAYSMLGLTDCITVSTTHEVLLVTDGFRLSGFLTARGRDAVNINHIRMLAWS